MQTDIKIHAEGSANKEGVRRALQAALTALDEDVQSWSGTYGGIFIMLEELQPGRPSVIDMTLQIKKHM